MSNTKHTPGPWIRHGIAKGTNPELAIVRDRIAGQDGVTVAEIEYRQATGIANARLIAAAPELLTALKALLDHEGEVAVSGIGTEHDTSALVAAKRAARAAVKKAEGVAP